MMLSCFLLVERSTEEKRNQQ